MAKQTNKTPAPAAEYVAYKGNKNTGTLAGLLAAQRAVEKADGNLWCECVAYMASASGAAEFAAHAANKTASATYGRAIMKYLSDCNAGIKAGFPLVKDGLYVKRTALQQAVKKHNAGASAANDGADTGAGKVDGEKNTRTPDEEAKALRDGVSAALELLAKDGKLRSEFADIITALAQQCAQDAATAAEKAGKRAAARAASAKKAA